MQDFTSSLNALRVASTRRPATSASPSCAVADRRSRPNWAAPTCGTTPRPPSDPAGVRRDRGRSRGCSSRGAAPRRRRDAGRARAGGVRRVPRGRDRVRDRRPSASEFDKTGAPGAVHRRVRRALIAIVDVNSGAGGVDAQDWAEMLLRMYLRWAERRGFDVEIDSVNEGGEAGISSATFDAPGAQRVRLDALRARRAPSGAHLAVRQQRPPPDELRVGQGHPVHRGRRATRSRSTTRTCASTCTGPRAPEASTSTSPIPRFGSPTCRPASSRRARTSGPSTRTRTGR